MGTHRQVVIMVPNDKLDCFGILRKKFGSDKNGLAIYPGPGVPPRADGSPLMSFTDIPLHRFIK